MLDAVDPESCHRPTFRRASSFVLHPACLYLPREQKEIGDSLPEESCRECVMNIFSSFFHSYSCLFPFSEFLSSPLTPQPIASPLRLLLFELLLTLVSCVPLHARRCWLPRVSKHLMSIRLSPLVPFYFSLHFSLR